MADGSTFPALWSTPTIRRSSRLGCHRTSPRRSAVGPPSSPVGSGSWRFTASLSSRSIRLSGFRAAPTRPLRLSLHPQRAGVGAIGVKLEHLVVEFERRAGLGFDSIEVAEVGHVAARFAGSSGRSGFLWPAMTTRGSRSASRSFARAQCSRDSVVGSAVYGWMSL